MWPARIIAGNHRGEKEYTTHVVRGAKAEDAIRDFSARKGQ
jgi:hypothetical protein